MSPDLRLERRFEAPPEAVFDAFVEPEVLRRWWAAGPDWECSVAEVDAREGGAYRAGMRSPEGQEHVVAGEYTEVRRPQRLAYTWSWQTSSDGEDSPSAGSLVTIDFVAEGDATRVVLVHSGLGTDESAEQHSKGWNACLDRLEEVV